MSAVLETVTQPAPYEVTAPRDTAVVPGFNSQSSWELAQRIGKAYASSTLVPASYQGNLANCIVALEMANRMGASPLMVMQNLYIVHGSPSWSSKFLIASFNQCGRFSAMRYRWDDARTTCRAWAIEKASGEELVGPEVSVDMAKAEGWSTKSGSKWKTMPELMLMYRAAAFFVRTYAPELSMGLRTDDEIIDMGEAQPVQPAPAGLTAVRSALAPTPATPADPDTGELLPPVTTPRRTYAEIASAITSATDLEAAALELDAARDEVPAEQHAELGQVYRNRWES